MKLLVFSIFVFALAKADPGDQDVEIQQVEVIEIPWQDNLPQLGDIPPIEYAPPKQDSSPPQQEYGPPKQEYGPPQQEYGPPKPIYGPPPELTTTESAETTTTELPTTTVISVNSTSNSTSNSTRARLQIDDSVDRGVYYIYHPSGALQKVVYSTKDDLKNMEYSAQLKYQNVEPIRGPVYTYDPETYLFSRVNRR
ncbi:pollen-specific leucine-rich repeat extensin-like protein 2 [Anoplophora glabripennis]|uniref:pollen-specific leucine-rich repeat extensin-like protein 2 n=1 Tax=Anoplophora glabripennis TaxID=217634 RepID=UPI000874F13A|nr:pollen-specific leucine-rich repeat extensin-like protein 2 [Anoplophora glabripennis]